MKMTKTCKAECFLDCDNETTDCAVLRCALPEGHKLPHLAAPRPGVTVLFFEDDTKPKSVYKVTLVKDYGGMPKGSVIPHATYDGQSKSYMGVWPSMAGSYSVVVPKKFCKVEK